MRIVDGVYVRCHVCRADNVEPLPDGWTYTVKRYYKTQVGGYISVHRPGCPQGFRPVVVDDA